jgi:hypothetical protein
MREAIPYCPWCLDTKPALGNSVELFRKCLCGVPWDDRDPRDTSHALDWEEIERKRYGKARRITLKKVQS